MSNEESAMDRISDPDGTSNDNEDDYWIRSHIGNKKLEDEYLLGDVLGRGVSSVVYKCLRKGRTEWACKVLKKKQLNKKIVQADIRTLQQLKHPNIVKIKEVFETRDEIQLIMELVRGGELFERIVERGQYSEEDASRAVRHILNALQYLHSNNIIHKDLKPENLLYQEEAEDSVLKLADYGMSKLLSEEHLAETRGCRTYAYTAPEVLLNKEFDSSIDLWSLGVVTYIMLCGFEPFWDEKGEETMVERIKEGNYCFPSPWWDEISDSAKELISKMLSLDPESRPTAEEALNHPWTLGISTPKLHMNETIVRLREFNARRRFRVATKVVLATQRALNFLSSARKSAINNDKTVIKCLYESPLDDSSNKSKSEENLSEKKYYNCLTDVDKKSLPYLPVDGCSAAKSLTSLTTDGDSLKKTKPKLTVEFSSQYKEGYVGLG